MKRKVRGEGGGDIRSQEGYPGLGEIQDWGDPRLGRSSGVREII